MTAACMRSESPSFANTELMWNGSFKPDGNRLIYAAMDGIFKVSADVSDDQRLLIQNSYRYFV